MSVTNTIFGRWKFAVADNFYIRNGGGSNIGVQPFKVHRLAILISIWQGLLQFYIGSLYA